MNLWLPGLALLLTVSIIGFSSQAAFAGNNDLTITKTANPQTIIQGQNTLVTYTYNTQNDLGQPLINCSLVDNQIGTIFSGVTLLNGDGRMDMGQDSLSSTVTNTATLTCETDGGQQVQRMDSATVTAVDPSVTLDKTANKDGGNTGVDPLEVISGTDVTYVYKATNTGDVTLTSCQVSDNILGNIGAPFNLAPGAMNTVTSAATQIDVDTMNEGTVTCDVDGVSGETVDGMDDANVDVVDPMIMLDKTANTDGGNTGVDPLVVLSGTDVFYVYKATNTGDVQLDNCQVSDNILGNIGSPFNLAPGAMNTVVSAATQIDVDTMNTGTVTCDDVAMTTPTAMDDANVDVVDPSVTLDKTANKDGGNTGVDPLEVISGTDVTYVYKATNTGDVTLTSCQVSDDMLGNIGAPFNLTPSAMNTVTSAATQIDVDTMNEGTVTCDVDGISGETVDGMDDANVDVVDPMIMLDKTANTDGGNTGVDPLQVTPGTTVFYVYKSTNTGDVQLDNCQVTDSNIVGNIGAAFNLAPGAMETVVSSGVVINGDTTNTGTVMCDPVAMETPVAQDDATVNAGVACVDLMKLADPTLIGPGETVKYTFDATNCGDIALKDCNITDDKLGPIATQNSPNFELPVGSGSESNTTSTEIFVNTKNTATIVCLTDDEGMEMVTDMAMATVTIVEVGGEFLPIDTTALFLGGIQSSIVWILPAAAGLAGAGYYLVKFRNKND